jgi:virginiamycin A acetyltransferase
MQGRLIIKRIVQGIALIVVFIPSLISGFGRFSILFTFFAQSFSVVPGFPGVFLRAAFYKLTLEDCSIDSSIAFGSFFSRRRVIVASNVSIGSYCIIGQARIGSRTQISSHVEIPGVRQHSRDAQGRLSDSSATEESYINIGADCWIGASAIIMANVGDQSTIGAGSVVVNDIPAQRVAVGVPAKAIKSTVCSEDAPQERRA